MKIFTKFFNWLFDDSGRNHKYLLDDKILFSAICLIAIGIIMVYSASIAYATNDKATHSQYFYIVRHLGYLVVGLFAGIITFNAPTNFWRDNAPLIGIIIVTLLIAVLIPHLGKTVNGSKRWIGVGILNLQPSELAKLGMAIFLSYYVCSKDSNLSRFFKDVLPVFAIIGIVDGLLLLEPDMGSATVVFIIALGILFMANIDKMVIIGFSGIGIIGFVVLILTAPYRMRRVLGFINPWDDALGKGYQLTHSLLAIGHGGWLGVGLGNSIEKLFYLPEAHTDFILAIIAEETGVAGVGIVLLLFWIIFYRGFSIIGPQAKLANRPFQAVLAQGISLWFFAQSLVNVGVTIGVLPTKGLTLPFVSFGGSSILVSCMALAILLKIDYENKLINKH
ncbi:MAG: putative lipid II flippase FtsW [Burkholderiales bacterium]|nr:putative lipid II flippase FtsW [Burkholderiales bacterium]